MDISDTLLFRLQARYPIMWLQSFDDLRVYKMLKSICRDEDYNLYRWNLIDGLGELGLTLDTILPVGDNLMDGEQMLTEVLRRMDSYEKEIFVIEGPNEMLQYAGFQMLVKKVANELFKAKKPMHVIFYSPMAQVPLHLARYIDILEVPPSTPSDYAFVLGRVAKDHKIEMSASTREKYIEASDGLTTLEADRIYTLAASETYLELNGVEVVERERERIKQKLNALKLPME